jgi:hypothetical protein
MTYDNREVALRGRKTLWATTEIMFLELSTAIVDDSLTIEEK